MLWVSTVLILVNIMVVRGDGACLQLYGRCQSDYIYCLGGYRSGLCSGASNRRCCLPAPGDSKCSAVNGFCQSDSKYCSGGYRSGLCAGGSNRRCCLPLADLQCNSLSGTCQFTTNYCSGSYQSGLCGGAYNRKCCLPGSTSGGGLSGTCLTSTEMGALQNKLIEYEGIRFTAYDAQPTNSYVDWTICVGFNLKRSGARSEFGAVLPGVNFDSVYAGILSLSRSQCLALFENDLTRTYIPRAEYVAGSQFCGLPTNVKMALVNAVYRGDLAYSHRTAELIRAGSWCMVRAEYLDNYQYKNCHQLGIPGVCPRMEWNANQFQSMC